METYVLACLYMYWLEIDVYMCVELLPDSQIFESLTKFLNRHPFRARIKSTQTYFLSENRSVSKFLCRLTYNQN